MGPIEDAIFVKFFVEILLSVIVALLSIVGSYLKKLYLEIKIFTTFFKSISSDWPMEHGHHIRVVEMYAMITDHEKRIEKLEEDKLEN